MYEENHIQTKLKSKGLASFCVRPFSLFSCKPIIRAASSQQTLSRLSEGGREREAPPYFYCLNNVPGDWGEEM